MRPVHNVSSLVWRQIFYSWRRHFWLMAVIALATALIAGALILGTSVRQSLRDAAFARTGHVDWALQSQMRWFSDEFSEGFEGRALPMIQWEAFTYNAQSQPVKVDLYGVPDEFFSFVYGRAVALAGAGPRAMLSAESLAHLGLKAGENMVIRLPQNGHFAEGLSWALNEQEILGLRLPTQEMPAEAVAFQPNSGYSESIKVFVPRSYLAEKLEKSHRSNLLLVKGDATLPQRPQLADYALQCKPLETGGWELSSEQSFIPEAIEQALDALDVPQERLFSYFVNSISHGDKQTPYSFVSGLAQPLGMDLAAGECAIIEWLAQDLGVKVGDCLDLEYFDLQSQGSLATKKASVCVREIISTQDRRGLIPPFPGFTDSESCNDWDPSLPVDTDAIRDKDEAYWDEYQGSPKLFLNLEDAQGLFGSPHGRLSAIRFEPSGEEFALRQRLEEALAEKIPLFEALPLKAINEQGVDKALDFSGLFLALSFFIIAAAFILLVLMCSLALQAKKHSLGVLRSLGYPQNLLMKLVAAEFSFYVFKGAFWGILIAPLYVMGILYLLNSIWQSVGAFAPLYFHMNVGDLVLAYGVSALLCLGTVYAVGRRIFKQNVKDELRRNWAQSPWTLLDKGALLLCCLGALACAIYPLCYGEQGATMFFFLSSFFLLLLAFKLMKYLLYRLSLSLTKARLNVGGLALRNITRHLSRSMALLSMLSLGMYICLLTVLNHRSMQEDQDPQSGTGGFYAWVETSIPIKHKLLGAEGREKYHLEALPANMTFIQLKRIAGSQAACLNLNRVLRPQLLVVEPSQFKDRFLFTDGQDHWADLQATVEDNVIPVIADAEVIQWSLGLKLGDELEYRAEGGQVFRLKFVAALDKSIFQSYVLISAENAARLYPHLGGSQILLLGFEAKPHVAELSRALDSHAFFLTTAAARLNLFNEVQNTYLMIFFALGTLGLMIASLGLLLVMQQSLLERQHELKVMRHMGYSRVQLSLLLFMENALLVSAGTLACLFALSAAIIPLYTRGLVQPPYLLMALSVGLIVSLSLLLIYGAARKFSV